MPEKVFVETIGCKLNQFESRAILESLRKYGFEPADKIEDSDYVVINTCSVTNNADVKSRQSMKNAKKIGKKVIATGCYATTDFEELNTCGFADIIVKNESKFKIHEFIDQYKKNLSNEKLSLYESLPASEFPVVKQFERTRAFLKIQDGCNKFCSYCKIPLARGLSRSMDPETVMKSLEDLVKNGYKEIVLTGVNISDYRFSGVCLHHLVNMAVNMEGDFRIRLSSLQPDEFDLGMLDLFKRSCSEDSKLTPHFHLSVQSGSDSVLKRMNRNYKTDYFLKIIDKIREVRPDCGITTDIITGFPGESEAEFMETVSLIKKAFFTRVHIFSYSPRSNTEASKLKDIGGNIKKERYGLLEQIASETGMEFIKTNILGEKYRVLIEAEESGVWTGYTPNYIRIYTKKKCRENEFFELKADEVFNDKGNPAITGS